MDFRLEAVSKDFEVMGQSITLELWPLKTGEVSAMHWALDGTMEQQAQALAPLLDRAAPLPEGTKLNGEAVQGWAALLDNYAFLQLGINVFTELGNMAKPTKGDEGN